MRHLTIAAWIATSFSFEISERLPSIEAIRQRILYVV
jgi:hypothetical protein